MAWKKRFSGYRARASGYYSRARSYGGARYKRAGGARGILGMSMPYIAGAAAGYFGDQFLGDNHQIVDNVALASVALPGSITSKLGPIRQVGQGYLLGRLVKSLVANNLNPVATVTGNIV